MEWSQENMVDITTASGLTFDTTQIIKNFTTSEISIKSDGMI